MKLHLYEYNAATEKPDRLATFTPDEDAGLLHAALPRVWRENGQELLPADGEEYLRAVHEEMQRGSVCWTEIEA